MNWKKPESQRSKNSVTMIASLPFPPRPPESNASALLTLPGYTLSQLIYEGVNVVVYRGRRDRDQRLVVVKSLKSDQPSLKAMARVRREFEIGRQFDHPGIIRYYSVEEHLSGLALILEDFGAQGLNAWIPTAGMSVSVFLPIAIQLTTALEAIHASQIIHKDLKPQSVVFNPQSGEAKIISFGLSSQLTRESPPVVSPTLLEGTLAYLSPEQTGRVNRAVDYRSDFYSLGVTFYEMLTGERPFQSGDDVALIYAHVARTPVPPHERRAHIPRVLSQIVLKLLAKTPEERYQSAHGLRADLEACWEQWQASGAIQDFELAQSDQTDFFQIPQKLYGRETEQAQLLTAFERVRQGATELVLVGGPSGSGKSALIQELRKPLAYTGGHFVYGKFDRLHRNVPYFALMQAFQELIHQWLAEGAGPLALWREKLLAALGPNGKVLVEAIPSVELIIGPQPPMQTLPPGESQNRFNLVFQDFIRVLAQPEQPLVLVLDDLQWADSGSLQMLRLPLTDPGIRHLLLVGAYRDDEVDGTHPLALALEATRQGGALTTPLELAPLSLESIRQLIAETLRCDARRAQPLAELALSRTRGNPLFVNQFLKSLYTEGHLHFREGEWQWEWDKIQALALGENVTDLIAAQLRQLKPETQMALAVAACLGYSFDLELLASVSQKSPAEALADLSEALEAGLLAPLDDNYKFLPYETKLSGRIAFKFLHDRVRQAADHLLATRESRRTEIHLQTGLHLWRALSDEALHELIFVVVDHLNLGRPLLPPAEHLELARLNLRAGQKALTSTAYLPALIYLNVGMQLLPEESWQTHPELTRDLYRAAAEAEYLQANFARAETLFADLERHAASPLEQALIHMQKVVLYTHVFRLPEAITAGLAGLQLLGHAIPKEPEALAELFPLEQQQISTHLAGRSIAELENLPRLTDPIQAAALNLMIALSVPAFYTRQDLYGLLTLKMVNLSLMAGNGPASAVAYNYYGFMLGATQGDYQSGYEFGQLALRLSQQFNDLAAQGIIHFGFSVFINHWREAARTNKDYLLQAYRFNLAAGNLLFANFTLTAMIAQMVSRGEGLDSILLELSPCLDFVRRSPHKDLHSIVTLARHWVLSLKDVLPQSPGQFDDRNFSEAAFLEHNQAIGNLVMVHWFYLLKAQVFYLYGQPTQAWKMIQLGDAFVAASVGQLHLAEHYFYSALILTTLYPGASPEEQTRYLGLAQDHQARMKTWADHCEANFGHKYLLITAELARLAGQHLEAMALYEQAIQSAQEHVYPQNQALANELAGRFYLARGFQGIARTYFAEARRLYTTWGASGKARQLEEQYPHWFAPPQPAGADTTIALTTTALDRFGVGVFDMLTLLKATQAISSEILLDRLLAELMKIVMENVGAQTGYLLLEQAGDWVMAAEAMADGGAINYLPARPLADARLPLAIIDQVARTHESVALGDAQQEGSFALDPDLIARQARSVLCAPLLFKNAVTGILYLENNLTIGAFTADRLEVLKLIAGQAAISLENARLYANLKEEVVERQRAEDTAQANERRFHNLFENAPLYICEVDLTQRPSVVLQANRRFRELYDWPTQPIVLASPDQVIPPEALDGLMQMIKRVRAGETVTYESTLRAGDRSLLPVRLIISPSPVGTGRIIVVAEDLTAEKQRRSEAEAIREDRRRIAREIHDGLVQNLLGLRLRMSLWQRLIETDPAQLCREVDEVREILSDSVEDVRRSIAALRPVLLDEVGFFPALSQLVADFGLQYHLEITLKISGPEARLPSSLEHALFRFIQEGLNNVVKHARARQVWISLNLEARERLTLTLHDDGIGFEMTRLDSFHRIGHLGLRQMRERIEQAGGILSVSSQPGEGVALQVILPLTSG
jgi:PAS domain S-box-containing protein